MTNIMTKSSDAIDEMQSQMNGNIIYLDRSGGYGRIKGIDGRSYLFQCTACKSTSTIASLQIFVNLKIGDRVDYCIVDKEKRDIEFANSDDPDNYLWLAKDVMPKDSQSKKFLDLL